MCIIVPMERIRHLLRIILITYFDWKTTSKCCCNRLYDLNFFPLRFLGIIGLWICHENRLYATNLGEVAGDGVGSGNGWDSQFRCLLFICRSNGLSRACRLSIDGLWYAGYEFPKKWGAVIMIYGFSVWSVWIWKYTRFNSAFMHM